MAEGVGTNRYAYAGNDPVNRSDPNGHWFGIDDLVATIGGAAVGIVVQAGVDVWNGELSSASDYAIAAASGAVAGETTLYAGPAAGGAAGGATHSIVKSLASGVTPTLQGVAEDAALGAAGGKVGQVVGKLVVSKLSNNMKGHIGTVITAGKELVKGNVPIGLQVRVALTGSGAQKTVVDLQVKNVVSSAVKHIESKYTTNPAARPGLTKAQKKATQQLKTMRFHTRRRPLLEILIV